MVSLDPANVLAASESPFLKTLSSEIEASCGAAPEKDESSRRRNRLDVQFHDVLPFPVVVARNR